MDIEDGVLDEVHLKVAAIPPVCRRDQAFSTTKHDLGRERRRQGKARRSAASSWKVEPEILARRRPSR